MSDVDQSRQNSLPSGWHNTVNEKLGLSGGSHLVGLMPPLRPHYVEVYPLIELLDRLGEPGPSTREMGIDEAPSVRKVAHKLLKVVDQMNHATLPSAVAAIPRLSATYRVQHGGAWPEVERHVVGHEASLRYIDNTVPTRFLERRVCSIVWSIGAEALACLRLRQ
jgi:hypothetical protein